jgi:hypothetical protein
LNGVLVMIERLVSSDRLFSRLFQDAKIHNSNERPLSSDLEEFLASETRRRIDEVFRKFEPICTSPFESPDNQDNSHERDQISVENILGREKTSCQRRTSCVAETFSESDISSGKGNSSWNLACTANTTSGDNIAPNAEGVSNMSKDSLVEKGSPSKKDSLDTNAMFVTENAWSNPNTSSINTTGDVSNIGFVFGSRGNGGEEFSFEHDISAFGLDFNIELWSNVEVDFDF